MTTLTAGWIETFIATFQLTNPWILIGLPLPILITQLIAPSSSRGANALHVPNSLVQSAKAVNGTFIGGRRSVVLIWLLWISLVVAISGPRVIMPALALPASGREIMLVMDLSGSMERRDFTLNNETTTRLEAVKRVGSDFIRRRAGDRIGLVIFAERAYVAAALTFDTISVAQALEEATIGIAGRSTGIGDGLALALRRLDLEDSDVKTTQNHVTTKVVILLSDGANNAGQTVPKDVAELAHDLGVRIHTIALGPRDLTDASGEQDVVDTETLRDIAQITGGTPFRVRATDDLIHVANVINELERNQSMAPATPLHHEFWPWPATLALVCASTLLATKRTL